MYLFEMQGEREEGEGEGDRGYECTAESVYSPNACNAWDLAEAEGRNQNHNPGVFCERQIPSHLSHHHYLPRSALVGSCSPESNPGTAMLHASILTNKLNAWSMDI